MRVAVIDYGIGNTGSVIRALRRIGAEGCLVDRSAALAGFASAILPGVGSFNAAMTRLRSDGWEPAIADHLALGGRLLGICLGMQLLMSRGDEGGETAGLGLIPGEVVPLRALGCEERLPHVGWNEVEWEPRSPLAGHPFDGRDFYFVHGYAAVPDADDHIWARTTHGVPFASMVGTDSIWGCQFHPEKSSAPGHALLQEFVGQRTC